MARASKRRSVWLIFGALLIVAGMATATTILFAQTFPTVNPAGLSRGCATLTAENAATTGGAVDFDCNGAAAITDLVSGSYTPSISPALPAGAALFVFPSTELTPTSLGTACTSIGPTAALPLTSPVSLANSGGGYDYCYALGPLQLSIPGFSVTWSQA